jgi:hypothetical protein
MSDQNLEIPLDVTPDETDISVRAYFCRMDDDRLREYSKDWSDDQVVEWDGNFRCDGALMLVCVERDIEIDEYRKIIEEHIERRGL